MSSRTARTLALSGLLLLGGPWAFAGPPERAGATQEQSPDPGRIVQRMCDYLKSQERFSFRADITDDQVYTGGKKLQYGFSTETFVQRPDKLRVNARGDLIDKQLVVDGETLTLYDPADKLYATETISGDIEAALDHADRKLGFRVALADLASPKLCEHLANGQRHALYVGRSEIGKVATDHLAFDRDDIQIQLWVASGKAPIPVKVLVTQKTLPGSPQWTAVLRDWKSNPRFKPGLFTFKAPAGAQRIAFAPPPAAPATAPSDASPAQSEATPAGAPTAGAGTTPPAPAEAPPPSTEGSAAPAETMAGPSQAEGSTEGVSPVPAERPAADSTATVPSEGAAAPAEPPAAPPQTGDKP